ncbi:hypothetical protein B9479_006808 [Cryptococcus floricola]|uniref:Uncharacterized protein n=1 Tax=Cryptococcus floricola TaxID=2591691 RepID=A0A5D3AR95_9TREE|nr:hypothetical protein B9479_006808 [Cryptococcus floricola]
MPVIPSIISPPRHSHSREFKTGNSHTVMHHRLYAPSEYPEDEHGAAAEPEQSNTPRPRRGSETNSERIMAGYWSLFDGLMDPPNLYAPSSTSINTDPDMNMPAYLAHLESHHFHDPSPALLDHCCRLASSAWYRSRWRPIDETDRGPTLLDTWGDETGRTPTRLAPRQDTTPVQAQNRQPGAHNYHHREPSTPNKPRRAPAHPSLRHRFSNLFTRGFAPLGPPQVAPLSGTTRRVRNTRSTPGLDEMGRLVSTNDQATGTAVGRTGMMSSRPTPTITSVRSPERSHSAQSSRPSWLRSESESSSDENNSHVNVIAPSLSSGVESDTPPPPPYSAPVDEFKRGTRPGLLRPSHLQHARSSQNLRGGRYSPYGSSSSSSGDSTSRDRRGYARMCSNQSSRLRFSEDSDRPTAPLLGPVTPSRTHHSRISRDIRLPSPAHPVGPTSNSRTALPPWGSFDVVGDRNEVQSFGNMGFVDHLLDEPQQAMNENMARRLSDMSMEVDAPEPGADRLLALALSPSPSVTSASDSETTVSAPSSTDYETASVVSSSGSAPAEPTIQLYSLYSVHIARFVEAVQYRNALHADNPSSLPNFTINGTVVRTWDEATRVEWDAQSLYPVAEYWACKFKQGRKDERRGRMCFLKLRDGLLHAYAFARKGKGVREGVEMELRDLWSDLADDWGLTR